MNEWMKIHHGIYRETNYDNQVLYQFINENEPWMVDDEKKVYHSILNNIKNHKGVRFFLIP